METVVKIHLKLYCAKVRELQQITMPTKMI